MKHHPSQKKVKHLRNYRIFSILLLLFGCLILYGARADFGKILAEETDTVQFKVHGKPLQEAYQNECDITILVPDSLFQKETEVWILAEDKEEILQKDVIWKTGKKDNSTVITISKGYHVAIELRHLHKDQKATSSLVSIDQKAPHILVKVNDQEVDSFASTYHEKMKFDVSFHDEYPDPVKNQIRIWKNQKEVKLSLIWDKKRENVSWNIEEEGDYRIQIRSEDIVGNISYFNKYRKGFMLDTSVPTIRILDDGKEVALGQRLEKESEAMLTIQVKEMHFDKKDSYILRNGLRQHTIWKLNDGYYQTEWRSKTTCEEDIGVHLQDEAGNLYVQQSYVHLSVDLDAPIDHIRLNDKVGKEEVPPFFQEYVQVHMIAEEKRLLQEKSYLIINKNIIPLNWKDHSLGKEAVYELGEGTWEVGYHLEDHGGRITEGQLTSTFIIDTHSPKVQIQMNTTPCQKNANTLHILVDDPHLNIDDIHVSCHSKQGSVQPVWTHKENRFSTDILCDAEGEYHVNASVRDQAGNKAIYSLNDKPYETEWKPQNFVIDKTAPIVSMSRSQSFFSNTQEQKVHIVLEEVNPIHKGVRPSVYLNGNVVDVPIKEFVSGSQLHYELSCHEEGQYEIHYSAEDQAHNQAVYTVQNKKVDQGTLKFVIDRSSPKIHLQKVAAISMRSQKVMFQVQDAHLKEYTVHILRNGIPLYDKTYASTAERELEMQEKDGHQGDYEVRITAKDEAGNASESEVLKFLIDHKLPEVQVQLNGLLIQQGESYLTNQKIQMHIVSSDTHLLYQTIQIYEDEKLIKTMQQKEAVDLTIPAKKDEHHHYLVKVIGIDTAGNKREVVKRFEIQTKIHDIAIGNDVFHGKPFAGNWKPMLANKKIKYQVVDCRLYKNGVLQPYQWGKEIHEDGDYQLELIVQDPAHNQTHLSPAFRFTIDKTAPIIAFIDQETKKEVLDHVHPDTLIRIQLQAYSPQEDKDQVLSVQMNGKQLSNQRQISLKEKGEYVITATAKDEAGNITKKERKIQVSDHPPVVQEVSSVSASPASPVSIPKVQQQTKIIWFYVGGVGFLLIVCTILYVRRRT